MKGLNLAGKLWCVCCALMMLAACSGDDDNKISQWITNAHLQEEGRTLSPGETIHLLGEGYQENDDVMLEFYWKSGEPLFPEGKLIGYRAEVVSKAADGVTVRLPFRKPESRVEVKLMRKGEMMPVGTLYIKDGTTPKDIRLYGIGNNRNGGQMEQITRCVTDGSAGYDEQSWTIAEHPDFHSVVSCWQCYGLCGLAERDGLQCAYFYDFCTAEWKERGATPTLAIFTLPAGAGALQAAGDGRYTITSLSADLERSNYVTATTKSSGRPQAYPLPEGLNAEQFGDYPGAYSNKYLLFSAYKGDGRWTPVAFLPGSGFRPLADVEAESLIPFSFMAKAMADKSEWHIGYAVVRSDGQSELYLLDDNPAASAKEPFAVYPERIRSISANYDKEGTFTIHFAADKAGSAVCTYSWAEKRWGEAEQVASRVYDEMVWTN